LQVHGIFHLLTLAAKKELARDLLMKTKEIDLLIGSLPGIGVSEEQQIQRLEQLEAELQGVQKKRDEAVKRKERLQKRLDEVIRTVASNAKVRR
jgi:mediator of RNA polymerase II transcription subunit 21